MNCCPGEEAMGAASLHAQVMKAMHRFHRINMGSIVGDISRGEYFTLEVLQQHKSRHPDLQGMYVSSLAGTVQMSLPAMSRMLRAMEEKGFITRSVDREDRRNTYILLTDEGEDACARARLRMRRFMDTVVREMGKENMLTMIALCSRLFDIMEAQTKTIDKGEDACSKS